MRSSPPRARTKRRLRCAQSRLNLGYDRYSGFARRRVGDGVDFKLTDEQEQLRRTVREFAEGEIRPHVMEWDEAAHFADDLAPKLAELGLFGIIFPEKYGGGGLGVIRDARGREEPAPGGGP